MVKAQIEESELLRKDTNQTVQKLREEFDSLVRDFMNYKKNEGNKGRDGGKKTSKSYVPDLGIQKVADIDRGFMDGGNMHRRNDHNNATEGLRRDNREAYDGQEPTNTGNIRKEQEKEGDKGSNPPFVPLLSLNKIQ